VSEIGGVQADFVRPRGGKALSPARGGSPMWPSLSAPAFALVCAMMRTSAVDFAISP